MASANLGLPRAKKQIKVANNSLNKEDLVSIVVQGGLPLAGTMKVNGAKNSTLAILSACILTEGEVTLDNVPNISDVKVMLELISCLGLKTQWIGEDTLHIKGTDKVAGEASYELASKLRASNLLLGPLMARQNQARVSLPGGCNIGTRPMDLHFKGLSSLGASVEIHKGYIEAQVPKRLYGAKVYLDFPSVGATENLMMAAALAEGQTILENVAKEPEVVDLANFLNAMGANVRGAGTDLIRIEGVESLDASIRYSVIPDRIEAGTFMVAAAATGGDVTLKNVIPHHLEPLSAKLREANVTVDEQEDAIRIKAQEPLAPINIKTMPYPGFATDLQSQMMSMLSTVSGTSIIVENIFENRFQVAEELQRMGANIKVEGRVAVIEGVPKLQGASVKATDLRAGAALIIAGLMAEGVTEIQSAHYVARGYRDLEARLNALGGSVRQT